MRPTRFVLLLATAAFALVLLCAPAHAAKGEVDMPCTPDAGQGQTCVWAWEGGDFVCDPSSLYGCHWEAYCIGYKNEIGPGAQNGSNCIWWGSIP